MNISWTGKCRYDGAKLQWVFGEKPFPSFTCEKCGRKFQMVESE